MTCHALNLLATTFLYCLATQYRCKGLANKYSGVIFLVVEIVIIIMHILGYIIVISVVVSYIYIIQS